MAVDHGAFIERLFAAMNRQDLALVDEFFTADVVVDYPQSGEEIRGRHNFRAVLENYPGTIEGESTTLRVAATDELRVVAPLFKVVSVEGAGNAGTYYGRSRYPDGTIWWVVGLYQLRDGRIGRSTIFFAQEFEAPEWRAPYVTRVKPD